MAIDYDAVSSNTATSGTTITLSHTCTGAERLLVVGVQRGVDDITASGVTYNGVALTPITTATNPPSNNSVSELWYLIAPDTGTNDIVVTYGTTISRASAGGISLTGCDQTSPIEAFNSAAGSSTTASVAVTTATTNAWVVSSVTSRSGTSNSHSAGSGETERYEVTAGTFHSASGHTEGPVATPGSVTMSTTVGDQSWVIAVAAIKSADGVIPSPSTGNFFAMFN